MATMTGSAAVQGELWGARARDFTLIELVELHAAVIEDLGVAPGTRLLDVGCGAGLFMQLAARRGAKVTGIDAAAPFIEIARERVPEAELAVGEMEELPYADDSFDVVTGLNAFQFAADPANALREAARVGRPGAPIVIATWGRPEQCEAAAYIRGVASLLPPPPPGAPGRRGLAAAGAEVDRLHRQGHRRRRRAGRRRRHPGRRRALPHERRRMPDRERLHLRDRKRLRQRRTRWTGTSPSTRASTSPTRCASSPTAARRS
jgi:ubiquinone/menaquinone biosynthesis C-methylase UbiE